MSLGSGHLDVEAKGRPDVVRVVTGRFERNPPLYYEMRLRPVTAELAAHPERLSLYDDAGVACDRLHRDDEAVQWMAKKRAAMAKFPASRDDRYRYHANLGTFLIHRWLRAGADPHKLSQAETARAEIAEAIRIHPDAHFGREKYQLAAMDWMLERLKAGASAGDSLDDRQSGFGAFLLNAAGHSKERNPEWEDRNPEQVDRAIHGLRDGVRTEVPGKGKHETPCLPHRSDRRSMGAAGAALAAR